MNIQETLKLPEETRVKFSYNGEKFQVVKRGYCKCLMSVETGYFIEDIYPLEEVVNGDFTLLDKPVVIGSPEEVDDLVEILKQVREAMDKYIEEVCAKYREEEK